MATKIFAVVPLRGLSKSERNTVINVHGAIGNSCQSLTAAFEQVLGKVIDEELKPEFFERNDGEEHISQNG